MVMTTESKIDKQERVGAVLVVGAGIAGIQASLDLAQSGFRVYLAEKTPSIGGVMAQLDKTFPTNDCAMCIMSPKLVDCARHLNIDLLAYTEVESVSGDAGDFTVTLRRKARFIDETRCTGCGECAQHCPVVLPNEFDGKLSTRKAVYRPFPQAAPNVFTIEKTGVPPCRHACPAGCNVQGYMALVREKKFKEAYALIRETVPLPAVCGRICGQLCEEACNRRDIEAPLQIKAIKRFVSDYCQAHPEEAGADVKEVAGTAGNEKIAIIGSGPAGLTAAFDLAKKGYQPVIYEALPKPGGMLRYGIPQYRLPDDILDYEINAILRSGVKIQTNTPVGPDLSIDVLLEQGYKAVFVAAGFSQSRRLGLEGEDLPGVLHGVEFLRNPQAAVTGRRVIVVGGGNVAIDVARTSKRLGAQSVTVVCLEARSEMPSFEDEVEDALAEGIVIRNRRGPKRVVGRNGNILGLETLVCESVFDLYRRFSPKLKPDTEELIEGDTVIFATGQAAAFSFLETRNGKIAVERGMIKADPVTLQTSVSGIFAGGDIAGAGGLAIHAIAHGHKAAISIDRYIRGEDLFDGRQDTPVTLAPTPARDSEEKPRIIIDRLSAEDRSSNFAEVEKCFTQEQAVAEAQRCLQCGTCSECMQCVNSCKALCINHAQEEETVQLHVGSILVAAGFEAFDPVPLYRLGYKRYADVITSLQFERILSASGPTAGHVQRPSDGKPPEKIAFIQCVGSRDPQCGHEYCSAVCCMYAIKEAVIAREHLRTVEPTIFYMDLRTCGKDFEKYYERAKNQYGVKFKRSRIASIEQAPEGSLLVRYESEEGAPGNERFDLVVLSVGLEPARDFKELAQKLGIGLNEYGFCAVDEFSPLDTTRPGIFACGACSGPRDIPETVTLASGASARAGALLAGRRNTLTKIKEYPPEVDVSNQEPRIGVFVCNCGINIAGTVDVPAVAAYVRTLKGVVYAEDNLYTCSQDTQEKITVLIKEKSLNRVIVASCTPRTHEPLFRDTVRNAGLNPYLFEMANIRDQCSWVHAGRREDATQKAKELVGMAVAKARYLEPLYSVSLPVKNSALIIGGGLAGMTAALNLADQGFAVNLVEREDRLGGNMAHLHYLLSGNDPQKKLEEITRRLTSHEIIKVWLNTNIRDISGFVGNFKTTISRGSEEVVLEHGAVIVATGAIAYKPEEYLYGADGRVVTQQQLEERLSHDTFAAKTVVMIQCVGSREGERMYCSRICCSQAVKNALLIKEKYSSTEVFVLYRDLRTYGFREKYYSQAREKGVYFIRYESGEKPIVTDTGAGLTVEVKDILSGSTLVISPDVLVLAPAIIPRDDAGIVAKMLKVPLTDDRFFLEAHMKLRPVDFSVEGVFCAGLAHFPKSVDETIAQAEAAAARAAIILSKSEYVPEAIVSSVHERICAGCGICVSVCSYGAPEIVETGSGKVSRINKALCKGCGACAMACPSSAVEQYGFKVRQMSDMIFAALE